MMEIVIPELKKCSAVQLGHVVIVSGNEATIIDIGTEEIITHEPPRRP